MTYNLKQKEYYIRHRWMLALLNLPKQSHVCAAHWSANARWSNLGFICPQECFFFSIPFAPHHTTPPKHRPGCLNLLQNTTKYVVRLVGLQKIAFQYGLASNKAASSIRKNFLFAKKIRKNFIGIAGFILFI